MAFAYMAFASCDLAAPRSPCAGYALGINALRAHSWGAAWIAMREPERLRRELDTLREAGVTCIRIVACSEGEQDAPLQVVPTLQPRPGLWNEKLARGMDLVLFELRKRRMRAVMTLSNQWSWSGGFATFLVWAVRVMRGSGLTPPLPRPPRPRCYPPHVRPVLPPLA